MERLVPIGRTLFGIALVGLGIDHFVFGEFITGRAPAWPETVPGARPWAYLTGAAFALLGIAILTGTKARTAAITSAALVFLWALLRHIPVVATSALLSGAWTQAGKAAVFVGGSLAIAATFPTIRRDRPSAVISLMNLESEFVLAGRVCLGLFLVLTGVQHFLFTDFVASLIPGWFPGDAVAWTYFAGVALIAGGTGLLLPLTAWLAALLSGLMIFSWFWIVHIPRAFESVSDGIAVFEALAVAGMLFVIAGCLDQRRRGAANG